MALRLIVDGYNLIGASGNDLSRPGADLEFTRERLLEELRRYKRMKGSRITVAFDGACTGGGLRTGETYKGIEVVFSRGREKADDLIIQMVRRSPDGTVVVSSDREVAERCRQLGASVISSREFREKMLLAGSMAMDGACEAEEAPRLTTKKKGPSRRPNKSGRRDRRRFGKL